MSGASMTVTVPGRREELDVLRGFAILAVLLLHAFVMTNGIEMHLTLFQTAQRLSTGIQLFFVLSGFLIVASIERCIISGEGLQGFLIRRGAKIVPLYVLFLNINVAVFLLSQLFVPELPPYRNSPTVESLTIENYLLHLAFLQGFVPERMHTLLDGSWSIVDEVYFYILFAILPLSLSRSIVRAIWLYAISIAIAIAFVLLVGRNYTGYSYYGFPAQLPCFLLGVLVYRIMSAPGFDVRFSSLRAPLVLAAVLLMIGLTKGESRPLGESNVYALCFAVLLLCATTVSMVLPAWLKCGITSLGRQSYALFFVHLLLLKGWYVIAGVLHIEMSFEAALVANVLIAVPLSWLLSTIVFDPIDRFFVMRAGRFLDRQARKPQDWSPA